MLALVAPTAWAFDAGHTAEPVLAAANTTAETIPITRRGESQMIGCRVGGRWAGGSVDRVRRVIHRDTPRRVERIAHRDISTSYVSE
jgi:hypothetical protein